MKKKSSSKPKAPAAWTARLKQLRAKLGDNSTNPRFIRTEPGVGYRFLNPPQ